MYPTPILTSLKSNIEESKDPNAPITYTEFTNNSIFWLFWSGVYMSPEDVNSYSNHAPLYVMLILLILEK